MTTPANGPSRPYRSVDPATGTVTRTFETASEEQVTRLLADADEGFRVWRATPLAHRAAAALRAGRLFVERAAELAALATAEMGKTTAEGRAEAEFSGSIFTYYAQEGPGLLADHPLPGGGSGRTVLQRRPLGTILGVMPWNFPYYQVARFAAPNLVLGNAVVVKHAESVPACAEAIADLLADAGIPPGVYTNVFASHAQVERMIGDHRVQGVSLTGSERAGAAVAAMAGANLKKCVLELGGSDPYIVLDSADVPASVDHAWRTRMYNNGQACNSNKRIVVMDGIYDEFVERLVRRVNSMTAGGPSPDGAVGYPPMASREAAEALAAQVADAVAHGATLHVGGELAPAPTAWFSPAVLTDVKPGTRAYEQELFGPVLVVYRVHSEEEAVALANDSVYGLGATVFSTEPDRAARVADRLEVGMTSVNGADPGGAAVPFGGVKRSGFGRELGVLGLDEFANKRIVTSIG
ncbi:aldehyde dehydrogenase family protein [Streptomyces sp. NPDC004838]